MIYRIYIAVGIIVGFELCVTPCQRRILIYAAILYVIVSPSVFHSLIIHRGVAKMLRRLSELKQSIATNGCTESSAFAASSELTNHPVLECKY